MRLVLSILEFAVAVQCQYYICYHCVGDLTNAVNVFTFTEGECLSQINLTDVTSVSFDTNSGLCSSYNTPDYTFYTDYPGIWKAWASNTSDCQNFTLEEKRYSRITNTPYDVSYVGGFECFWSCLNMGGCYAIMYDATGLCSRFTVCYNESCVLDDSDNSFVYLRHCNNECSPLFDTALYTVSTPGGRGENSWAYYSCRDGYYITSGALRRSCNSSSLQWNDGEPVCEIIDCGFPVIPNNSNVSVQNGTTYLQMAVYSCETNYNLSGPSTRICQSNGSWSDWDPRCLLDCFLPSAPSFGTVNAPEGTLSGAEVVYNCSQGYFLVSNGSRVCQSDGIWNGTDPTCEPVDCGIPFNNLNSDVNVSSTSYLSTAEYSCSTGYLLDGVTYRTCDVSGQWSDTAPDCLPVVCVTSSGELVTVLDIGQYDSSLSCCEEGFVVDTSSWSFTLLCVTATCIDDPLIDNGNVTLLSAPNTPDMIIYTCFDGYVLNGDSERFCQTNTSWNGTQPVCEPLDCGTPLSVGNGTVEVNETTYGNIVSYTCLSGYQLVGPSVLLCNESGLWHDLPPKCQFIDCGTPVPILHGSVTAIFGTTFNRTATYLCNVGYSLAGTSKVVCNSTGDWDPLPPTCSIIDCGDAESPVNGSVILTNGTTLYEMAMYLCNLGFYLDGSVWTICNSSGLWSGSLPTCHLIDCGPLPDIANGSVFTTNGSLYGSVAYYRCDSGYTLSHMYNRTCMYSQLWSYFEPYCIRLGCVSLTNPTNGEVVLVNGTNYGSVAYYRCNAGFVLSHHFNLTCFYNGLWSYFSPLCLSDGTSTNHTTSPSATPETITSSAETTTASTTGATSTILSSSASTRLPTTDSTTRSSEATSSFAATTEATTGTTKSPSTTKTTSPSTTPVADTTFTTNTAFSAATTTAATLTTTGSITTYTTTPQVTPKTATTTTKTTTGTATLSLTTKPMTTATDQTTLTTTPQVTATTMPTMTTSATGTGTSLLTTKPGEPTTTTATPTTTTTDQTTLTTTQQITTAAPATTTTTTMTTTSTSTTKLTTITPSTTTASQRVIPRIYIMACQCKDNKTSSFDNLTQKEIIDQLIQNTTIDVKSTSAYIYQYKARTDSRLSSLVFGIVGSLIVAAISIVIILNDFLHVLVLRETMKDKKRRKLDTKCKSSSM